MPQSQVGPRTIAPPLESGAPSDFELMKGIQAGDPDALSQLYDRYNGILKALILRVIHNEAEADDLLQEIFMEIWNQAKNFSEQKGKPLGWMVTRTPGWPWRVARPCRHMSIMVPLPSFHTCISRSRCSFARRSARE